MKTIVVIFSIYSLSLFICSCTPEMGTIRFTPTPPELYTKNDLKEILAQNPEPKIVLKVPVTSTSPVDKEIFELSNVYNAIERELVKGHFIVRDRELFKEVLSDLSDANYTSIHELTDTDLILEITDIDLDIKYRTNKYLNQEKQIKLTRGGSISMRGFSIEFKIIVVKENQIGGFYKFSYTPCESGCVYWIEQSGKIHRVYGYSDEIKPYEYVEKDALEKFISKVTEDLISELRDVQ